jgi:UDP-glucose 4-epimerase
MKILITGGLGYLGSRLAEHLTNCGDQVRLLTRREPEQIPGWASGWEVRSIRNWDRSTLKAAAEGAEAVFHLAKPDAQRAARFPAEAIRAGGEQTWNLLEAVASHGLPIPFINVSSIAVYGPHIEGLVTEQTPAAPVHPYAVGHRFSEIVTRRFSDSGTAATLTVRLSNLFGKPLAPEAAKWALVFNDLCRQAVRRGVLELKTPGNQVRNFMCMTDGVRALRLLLDRVDAWPEDGIILIGGPTNMSILEAANRIAGRCEKLWGRALEIRRPREPEENKQRSFRFDRSRLQSLGFSWTDPIDREIDEILKACRAWEDGK